MLASIGIFARRVSYPPYGTFLSSYCKSVTGYDAAGTLWSGTWEQWGIYANGTGGTYESQLGTNQNGCYYPSGYVLVYTVTPSYLDWSYFYNVQGGTATRSGNFNYLTAYYYVYSDGMGGSTTWGTGSQASYGTIIDTFYNSYENLTYTVTYTGDTNYTVTTS